MYNPLRSPFQISIWGLCNWTKTWVPCWVVFVVIIRTSSFLIGKSEMNGLAHILLLLFRNDDDKTLTFTLWNFLRTKFLNFHQEMNRVDCWFMGLFSSFSLLMESTRSDLRSSFYFSLTCSGWIPKKPVFFLLAIFFSLSCFHQQELWMGCPKYLRRNAVQPATDVRSWPDDPT